jgi:hypothetical protein
MKLVAPLQLKPTAHQATLLQAALERANAACNAISDYAWQHQNFQHYALHKELYTTIRDRFSLSAQLVVRCLAKVGDAYKLDRTSKRQFKPHGSIAYDARILKYFTNRSLVSIRVLPGRETIPYVCGERQAELLKHRKGESDLV